MSTPSHAISRRLLVLTLVCAPLVAVVGQANASDARIHPHIKLYPRSGPPSTVVTVRGAFFCAHETVTIDFDTTQVGSTQTSGGGTFHVKVTVPADATLGIHSIAAHSGCADAARKFRVT